jgi:hypothetical protein
MSWEVAASQQRHMQLKNVSQERSQERSHEELYSVEGELGRGLREQMESPQFDY